MTSWELENVEAAHRAHPTSFFIPAETERKGQSVGDEVRLHFLLVEAGETIPRAERMWVKIIEKAGDPPQYVGELRNEPQFIKDLFHGDRVAFRPEHIAQTLIGRSDPRWLAIADHSAIVSKKVFDDGEAVLWMYREATGRTGDSGWRLFSGHESEDYLDDPKNARVCNVAWLLDWDTSLESPLRSDVGAAFERAGRAGPWLAVKDWSPPED